MEVEEEDSGDGRSVGTSVLELCKRHDHADHGEGVSDPADLQRKYPAGPVHGEGVPGVSTEGHGGVDTCKEQLLLRVVTKTAEERGAIDCESFSV